MGTIMVAILLLVVVGLAIYSIVKAKKNGKSIQCGGDCQNCGSSCHK